ncbi:putative Methyltransferase CmcJ [Seiridium cardinale]
MAPITRFLVKDKLHQRVKPYVWHGPDMETLPRSNFELEERELNLTDLRATTAFKPTIEKNGFCFLEHKSRELANTTGPENCTLYLNEMARLIKERLGTEEVWPINAYFRDARVEGGRTGHLLFAHVDNTARSSWDRLSVFLTLEERERVTSGKARMRIINVWRPIFNHAEDFPFAVCDIQTNLDPDDVVAVDSVDPESVKELAYFTWNPNHRWYWASNQTPDEIIMMTQYDTHPPGGWLNSVPHASFRNEDASPGCPPRRSLEARFLVLEPAPFQQGDGTGLRQAPADNRTQPWKGIITIPPAVPPPIPTADNRPIYL